MRYVFDETLEIRMKIQSWNKLYYWILVYQRLALVFSVMLHFSPNYFSTFNIAFSLSLSLQYETHTNNLKHFLYQSNLFHNISSSALIQGYLTALSRSSLKFDSPSMFQINRTNSLFQDLTMSEMLVAHTYVCSSSVLPTGSNRINQTKHIIYVFIVFSPFNFVATCTLKL